MPTASLPAHVQDAAFALCEGLATPVALSVAILLRYGEWDQLAEKQIDPHHYVSGEHYWRDAASVSFLRKLEDLPTSFDRKAKAYKSFFECEAQCFSTNERLSPFLHNAYALGEEGVLTFIVSARKYIRSWLGPFQDIFEGKFGPGATYGDRGKLTTVPDKMSSRPTLTTSALGVLFPWASTAWAKACAADGRSPEFVRGNRFTTVPKDATKFRGIAIEPSLNLFYQLGLGREIRRRLLKAGINLRDGQDIHRRVACEASLRGHMSTLDLSNASDTVCRNLVKLLLPTKWYEALESLRSPTTEVDGKRVVLEKFSSMGNGFTFELETLLFAGICAAALESCGHHVNLGENLLVYGDDIIVPSDCSRTVISALQFFGMTPNGRKSFVEGPFRESCGGDYFMGRDVRPFFLKELPSEPQQIIAMANGLRRMADSVHDVYGRFDSVRRAWFSVLDALPSSIRRLRGPKGLGDLTIHDEQSRWQTRWRHGIRYIRVYRPARFRRVGWEHFKSDVQLATALYGTGDGKLGVTPRDAVLGYKEGWVAFS